MNGFLLVNKPSGMTSRDCVNRICAILYRAYGKSIKIGHAGTLDRFASGLLIIGISREATRELRHIMCYDKAYVATAQFGLLIDTLDNTGKVLLDTTQSLGRIEKKQVQNAIASIGRQYVQIPPLYSALKYNGIRLSDLARSNTLSEKDVNRILLRKQRIVDIHAAKVIDVHGSLVTVRAEVSHGTYIRSFMNDIAQRYGTYATTIVLRREKIGPFSLTQATDVKNISCIQDVAAKIIMQKI